MSKMKKTKNTVELEVKDATEASVNIELETLKDTVKTLKVNKKKLESVLSEQDSILEKQRLKMAHADIFHDSVSKIAGEAPSVHDVMADPLKYGEFLALLRRSLA